MAIWSTRTSGYKLGVGVLFLGSAFYLIGFASPFWLHVRYYEGSSYFGLWMGCDEHDEGITGTCTSTAHERSWFKAVQVMQSLGLTGVVVACVYAVVINARQTSLPHNGRLVETLSAFSGISGFIGCMIFMGQTTGRNGTWGNNLGWSFGLNVAGCVLFVIAALIIYNANSADRAHPATPGAVVLSGAEAPVAAVTTLQQSGVYPPPGQGYVPQPVYGYDQGYSASAPGGYALATASPIAGYVPSAPQAGYAPG